jgi:DNA-binding beta-propeller fold protein YncE
VTTISVGRFPTSLAVNPVTTTVYVANSDPCGGITVIDGKTEEVTKIKAGIELDAVAVNAATNQIYAYDPENLTIIDGETKKTTSLLLPIPVGMPRYTSSSTCRWSTPVSTQTGK